MQHIAGSIFSLAQRWGKQPVFFCEGRERSADELLWRVQALADALRTHLNLCDGDRVAIAAAGTDSCLEALLAVAVAGGVAVPLNTRWSETEAIAAATRVGARIFAFDASCAGWWASMRASGANGLLLESAPGAAAPPSPLRSVFLAQDLLAAAAAGAVQPWTAGPREPLRLRVPPDGLAMLVFTSGTTGSPKAARITHAALGCASAAKLAAVGYCAQDTYLHAAPLFHVGGISSALALLAAGGRHVFLPRFSAAAAAAAIDSRGVTALAAVPAALHDLAALRRPLPSVQRVLLGGGAPPPGLLAAALGCFPNAHLHFAYGMTEAASSVTFCVLRRPGGPPPPPPAPVSAGALVGWPAPGLEVAVLRAGGGFASAGEEGEVAVRGGQVFDGYWAEPAASASAAMPGGWLRTGDVGAFDASGALWLRGRLRDVIRSGGESVQAAEVEAALLSCPGVAAAAAVALPHPRLGEAVACLVVLRPGQLWDGPTVPLTTEAPGAAAPMRSLLLGGSGAAAALSPEALREHCRAAGLAGFKLPRVAAAAAGAAGGSGAALPVNTSGKVLKAEVRRAMLAAGLSGDWGEDDQVGGGSDRSLGSREAGEALRRTRSRL